MRRIHFIGIGGIGMSGIALLCLKKGYKVSGSDIHESENTRKLVELGADIYIGHSPENIKNNDIAVYSSAIKNDNCELRQAREQKIPVFQRAQFLVSLMDKQAVIAVTGAHGKTTTSSLTAHLLTEANLSPTIAVGGIVGNISNNAKLGLGKYFVAEADESDGTFLLYKPKHSIITNIDSEHLDFYKNFENIKKAFRKFVLNNHKNGCIFWCFDDKEVRKIIKSSRCRSVSFGLEEQADIYATNIEFDNFSSQFDVFYKNKFVARFKLSMSGRHNISNSLAVIGLGLELKLDIDVINRALSSFLGVNRRFQVKRDHDDILIIDDYAHHPSEILATIQTARRFKNKRLVVVFQPHRYSRTKLLLKRFSQSFFDADHLFITDIYPAGEKRIKGVDSVNLCRLMKGHSKPKTKFVEKEQITNKVSDFIRRGDLVLFLGAGDISKICDGFVESLKRQVKV
ncbi:UDP-N-acetylmuramate--L-alanine ligase [Candidatus Omnitrophota bacterium]